MDQDAHTLTKAEELEDELRYAPTMIIDETGIHPVTEKPVSPSPVLVALMEEPPILFTGLVWGEMVISARIDVALAFGAPVEAVHDDVLSAFPEQTKLWITGWQMQVNTGSCWNTSGSIGRTASELIDEGFLLLPKTATVGAWNSVPGRGDVAPGTKGSPAFVRMIMGDAYLAWISAID